MKNPESGTKDEIGKGGLKSAVHGLFAKIQSKTGLRDEKIDEFQEKWLAIPRNRTKYKHLVDAPTIMAEELFAIFNDIIDFMQAQDADKSQVFESLRVEAVAIKTDPEGYLGKRVGQGKSLWKRGLGFAKGLMGGKKKIETRLEEGACGEESEMSDFEKTEMEDKTDEEEPIKPAKEQGPKPKPKKKAKSAAPKPKTIMSKGKGN
jgi:hypothetical protein